MKMFCPNCGTQNPDGVKFCANCGTPLTDVRKEAETIQEEVAETVNETVNEAVNEPVAEAVSEPAAEAAAEAVDEAEAAEPAEKKKLPVKLIAIAAAALLLVVLGVIFIPKLFAGGSKSGIKDNLRVRVIDDVWYGISKSGKVVKEDNEDGISSRTASADNSVLYFLTGADELWSFNGSKFTKIDEDVDEYLVSFNGCAAYTNEEEELYLYNGSKSTKVADEIYDLCCISTDGKSVGYTKRDDDELKGYYYDGKEHDLGKERQPIMISDSAQYIYFYYNSSYYVQKKDSSDSRVKLGDYLSNPIFNESATQIIYYNGENSYICEKGGDKEKVSGNAVYSMISGSDTVGMYSNDALIYGVSSLKNHAFYTANGVVLFLKNNGTTYNVVKDVSNYVLRSDGKTLVYFKKDKIARINIAKEDADPVTMAEDVESFIATSDGALIMFRDDNGDYCTIKNNSKAQKVTDELDDYYSFGDKGIIYEIDDELFLTTGGKGTKLSGFGDYESLSVSRFYILVTNEDGDVYQSTTGKSFTKIIDGE